MTMPEGLRRLYAGEFNSMSQEDQDDGTMLITLSKEGEKEVYRFKVRNLYEEDEEVVSHEVIKHTPPAFLMDRLKKARRRPHGRPADA